jgi:hypothetical protein
MVRDRPRQYPSPSLLSAGLADPYTGLSRGPVPPRLHGRRKRLGGPCGRLPEVMTGAGEVQGYQVQWQRALMDSLTWRKRAKDGAGGDGGVPTHRLSGPRQRPNLDLRTLNLQP